MLRHTLQGDTLTVFLKGELDHNSAKEMREWMDGLIDGAKARRLVIDLSGLEFMDSSGIGVIIGRYNKMQKRGGTVGVRRAGPRINRIFNLSGVYELVEKL
ncbi:MAG: STAS domain-containing protein [Christensenellaceae bacterium]|jgi:stage II sporulation protein AA (anti-sigma F factor antagonist)|nr:STAS domain-containing protein [Christensenellaceae bacterium]